MSYLHIRFSMFISVFFFYKIQPQVCPNLDTAHQSFDSHGQANVPKILRGIIVTDQRIGFVMLEFLNKGDRKEKRSTQRLSLLLMTKTERNKICHKKRRAARIWYFLALSNWALGDCHYDDGCAVFAFYFYWFVANGSIYTRISTHTSPLANRKT